MGENKLTLISADDWEGLYYDGMLIFEEHELQKEELVKFMRSVGTLNVDFKSLNYLGLRWIREVGSLPGDISEIPNEYIEQ
ncbi:MULTISPECIES: hypothetical protein [unclassified Paenibacillus]|uniref:hypothetical protein n=1 Tax=unclassified Paenibacillus TaxID=185978 RepID=UPI00020D7841|nr:MULTISPECIES: hypothetical protein [unclassified Paenibacillus]EGL19835.1 hypothetical protein HMPREF9413_4804 [Paenibacillus sp. HGF7]EPD81340.1 hypothetical protein HMPREF1207_05098 [Paenibacillus sp. HGH0039]